MSLAWRTDGVTRSPRQPRWCAQGGAALWGSAVEPLRGRTVQPTAVSKAQDAAPAVAARAPPRPAGSPVEGCRVSEYQAWGGPSRRLLPRGPGSRWALPRPRAGLPPCQTLAGFPRGSPPPGVTSSDAARPPRRPSSHCYTLVSQSSSFS